VFTDIFSTYVFYLLCPTVYSPNYYVAVVTNINRYSLFSIGIDNSNNLENVYLTVITDINWGRLNK